MRNQKENKGIKSPCLYCIHSQKGGVGKTAIAIAIAGFATLFQGKKTLLIDADLTGTSHLDILGWLDNDKNYGETTDKLHYFNELILANPKKFEEYTPIFSDEKERGRGISRFYQKACLPNDCTITYMPSSPCFEDIQKVVPLISQEDHLEFFQHRLEDIIVTAIMDGFKAIIVDHPPGLFGISKASLNMVFKQAANRTHSKKGRNEHKTRLDKKLKAATDNYEEGIKVKALLVTTPDQNDYMALVPSFAWLLENYKKDSEELDKFLKNLLDFGEIDLLVNKGAKHPIDVMSDIENSLKINFPDSRREIDKDKKVLDFLIKRATDTDIGAPVCQYVEGFSMNAILETITKLKTEKEKIVNPYESMPEWCKQIGKITGIIQ